MSIGICQRIHSKEMVLQRVSKIWTCNLRHVHVSYAETGLLKVVLCFVNLHKRTPRRDLNTTTTSSYRRAQSHVRSLVFKILDLGYVYKEPCQKRFSNNCTGSAFCLHGVILEPVQNGSKWIQNSTCNKVGPALDPFWKAQPF